MIPPIRSAVTFNEFLPNKSGIKLVLIALKTSLNGPIERPSSSAIVSPRKISIPARVVMNAGIFMNAVQKPCQAPINAPMARHTARVGRNGMS